MFNVIIRLAVWSKYFESRKYCPVEVVEKMRLYVHSKCQFQRNLYFISLKFIFVTGVCSTMKYVIIKKADSILWQKIMCWLNITVNQPNTFCKVIFLVSKFFCDLIHWKQKKHRKILNHNANVSSETFHWRKFYNEFLK